MKDQKAVDFVKEYWIILAFVIQLIVSYTTMQQRTTALNEQQVALANRVEKLEKANVDNALVVSSINARLASIDTSIIFIKDQFK